MKRKFRLVFVVWALTVSIYGAQDSDIKILSEHYPPYNMLLDGKAQGIGVDVIEAILKQMNSTQVKDEIEITNWSRAYNLALKKKNHMVFSTARTKDRESMFKWVGPIYQTSIDLIALKEKKIKIDKIADLKKYKVGVILNDIGEQLLLKKGVDKKNLEVVSGQNAVALSFKKMEKNRIDMFSYIVMSAKYTAEQEGFDIDKYESIYTLQKTYGYFAFNKNTDDKIIQKWQKALDEIKSNGIFDEIMKKY